MAALRFRQRMSGHCGSCWLAMERGARERRHGLCPLKRAVFADRQRRVHIRPSNQISVGHSEPPRVASVQGASNALRVSPVSECSLFKSPDWTTLAGALEEAPMRTVFLFATSIALAGSVYLPSAAALPAAVASIGQGLALGEAHVQQAHVRRHRHRHHAPRRYRGYRYGFYPYIYLPPVYVPFDFGHHGGHHFSGHHFGGHHLGGYHHGHH